MDSNIEKSKMYMGIKKVLQNKELVDIDDKCIEIKYIVEEYIKQALKPPTAEEVCEALSEYYDCEVQYVPIYSFGSHSFYLRNGKQKNGGDDETIVSMSSSKFFKGGHQIIFYKPLTKDLITLIGRFYEGLQ